MVRVDDSSDNLPIEQDELIKSMARVPLLISKLKLSSRSRMRSKEVTKNEPLVLASYDILYAL